MNVGKTGSTSLTRMLETNFDSYVWKNFHITAHVPKCAPQHICHLPEQFKDYFIFASVRNPYTHELSRFCHFSPERRPQPATQENFELWIRRSWIESFAHKLNMHSKYEPPVGCVKYDISAFVRMENMTEDFHKLPFVDKEVEIPHRNKTKNDPSQLFYTVETASIVHKKRKSDFDLFGYSKMPPNEVIKVL